MPRPIPNTSYTTRSSPSTEYERPRFIEGNILCDIAFITLVDISWERLATSEISSTLIPKITTTYT